MICHQHPLHQTGGQISQHGRTLRTGSKLPMHYIVTKINSQLELLENSMSYVDVIDDSGDIVIQHDETFPTFFKDS